VDAHCGMVGCLALFWRSACQAPAPVAAAVVLCESCMIAVVLMHMLVMVLTLQNMWRTVHTHMLSALCLCALCTVCCL
jgi:hypothetical protein